MEVRCPSGEGGAARLWLETRKTSGKRCDVSLVFSFSGVSALQTRMANSRKLVKKVFFFLIRSIAKDLENFH